MTNRKATLGPVGWIGVGGIVFGVAITSAWAARPLQGSVGQVSPTDAEALGPVGFRIWSALLGGETNLNDNATSCRNVRCIRSYVVNTTLDPGGYIGNQEATQAYNGDVPGQPFYELVDASMNDAAGNHIGFYGVSGVSADNSGVGNFLAPDCPASTATNCFGRIDANDAGRTLVGTQATYGAAPQQIRAIGGLTPIPTVNASPASCTPGFVCLSWSDPPTYSGNMRPGTIEPAPPSPVRGVRLYKTSRADCLDPSGNDPGWTPVATPGHPDGRFDLGETTTQDALPPDQGCNFYALTVRLVGPGGGENEVETFRVGAHTRVARDSSAVLFIDEFSDGLAPGWRLHDPAGDALKATIAGHFVMAVPPGSSHDCWTNGLMCPRLSRPFVDLNLVFETKIDGAALAAGNHDYGILVLENPSNFLRFEFWSGGSGVYVRAYRVANGIGFLPAELSTSAPVALGASNALRVKRIGDSFTLEYKIDEGGWTTVGTFVETGFRLGEAGVFVNNAVGDPLAAAHFDYFSASVPGSSFAAAPLDQTGSSVTVPHDETPEPIPRSGRPRSPRGR